MSEISSTATSKNSSSSAKSRESISAELSRNGRLIAMGQMAATLAHEIRNPLGSMELYCSLLKKDLQKNSEQLALAEHIHQGIRTLDRVITNCLQFCRDIEPRAEGIIDISAFLEESIRTVEAHALADKVSVLSRNTVRQTICIDPYLATQAIVNVLHNAIDAAAAQEDETRKIVEIESTTNGDGGWQLRISDRGCGIASEDRERIFDPFFTTKRSGTGLGLAVVNSILMAHQGEVMVESEIGAGTTVILNWGKSSFRSQG